MRSFKMYVTAIVLAAGRGLRFSRQAHLMHGRDPASYRKTIEAGKSGTSKPLVEINSKPVIIYSLTTLSRLPEIKDIILVANRKNLSGIAHKIRQYRIMKIRNIVMGGRERQDSVINGLRAINLKTNLVLIHDGVRPFIDERLISSVISEATRSGAAIVGVPVKATIKMVAYRKSHIANRITVKKTLNRNNLWEIQTPQVFKKDLILKAYNKFGDTQVSDDATLVEKLGVKVSIVTGSYKNIKITTPEDLVVAQAIASKWKAG